MEVIKFLPSYVGSKKFWVSKLQKYAGSDMVELFCGSAVLSANLAKTAVLNDIDPYIHLILSRYDELIVPASFSEKDYFDARVQDDWWKYVYCLQRMSFSGVFRYSKNGYNVPIKPDLKAVDLRDDYKESLKRWEELKPQIIKGNYLDVPLELLKNKVIVLDPPYQDSQASYNVEFNYAEYWEFVDTLKGIAKTLIIFDRQHNLEKGGVPVLEIRNMRVNGKRKGDVEAMGVFENGEWLAKKWLKDEEIFDGT